MSGLDLDAEDVRFIDGSVRVDQPKSGYRAGNDAVLLAASLAAKPGTKILDLGCGSAIIILLADHKLPKCQFTGIEDDPDMVRLAQHNTSDYKNVDIVDGDVGKMPPEWNLHFDQVVSNPPFFDDRVAVRMSEAKAPAFVTERLDLALWISAMLKVLKPRGTGTLIYRADGLEKILHALFGKAGNIRILPIHSHADDPAKRIIVQFRKGVKSESALLAPLIMHDRDGSERFTADAAKILCGEMPINMQG